MLGGDQQSAGWPSGRSSGRESFNINLSELDEDSQRVEPPGPSHGSQLVDKDVWAKLLDETDGNLGEGSMAGGDDGEDPLGL